MTAQRQIVLCAELHASIQPLPRVDMSSACRACLLPCVQSQFVQLQGNLARNLALYGSLSRMHRTKGGGEGALKRANFRLARQLHDYGPIFRTDAQIAMSQAAGSSSFLLEFVVSAPRHQISSEQLEFDPWQDLALNPPSDA